MLLKQIFYGTPEYEEELKLRDEVLRRPLGFTFTPEFLEADKTDVHFAAFDDQVILGCLLLTRVSNAILKMRQVAVSVKSQGQGVGKKLVAASESYAVKNGFELIKLHARETAVPFYLALGYEIVGDAFEEVGIPHRFMQKRLGKL